MAIVVEDVEFNILKIEKSNLVDRVESRVVGSLDVYIATLSSDAIDRVLAILVKYIDIDGLQVLHIQQVLKADLVDGIETGIVGGLDVAQRWGVADGQLSLASKMINSQAINRVVRQYVDGEVDAAAAVAAMNEELSAVQ